MKASNPDLQLAPVISRRELAMWVAWPAFLVAAVLEMMVFAVLDPQTMMLMGEPIEWSRTTVYAITFFIFWGMLMISNALALLLTRSARQINGFRSVPTGPLKEDWMPPAS